jgi:hypothetical protein
MSAETNELSLTILLGFEKFLKAHVMPYIHLIPIVQPCSFQVLVIHVEPQRMNEVQTDLRSSTEAGNVARVSRNFWVKKNHMKARVFDNQVLIHHSRCPMMPVEIHS